MKLMYDWKSGNQLYWKEDFPFSEVSLRIFYKKSNRQSKDKKLFKDKKLLSKIERILEKLYQILQY